MQIRRTTVQNCSLKLLKNHFQVISYTLKDIKDEDQYMVSLGMARTAEIVRDARIGEAVANRDAQIEVAIAEEQRLAAKLSNKTEVERYKRDYEVMKAAYDCEVETSRAEAELAYSLQEAKVKQRIKEETMTTEIIERAKHIEVSEQEVLRYGFLTASISEKAVVVVDFLLLFLLLTDDIMNNH